MTKKGSFFRSFIMVLVPLTAAAFVYVFIGAEIKVMNKEILKLEELLTERKNKLEIKSVEAQKLSSEERIIKAAEEELGLQRKSGSLETIIINKNQIEQLEKVVNSKYE